MGKIITGEEAFERALRIKFKGIADEVAGYIQELEEKIGELEEENTDLQNAITELNQREP